MLQLLLRRCSVAILALMISGCAELNRLSDQLFTDTSQIQAEFDRRKAEIEGRAHRGQITWVAAARQVRELDRSYAGQGTWKFDSNDEEYHAYCVLAAEQLDARKISFTYYDALRTRKFNEIQARRR